MIRSSTGRRGALAAYQFVFGTVRSDQIAERRIAWDADLDRMDTLETS